jgi:hypothetical protein
MIGKVMVDSAHRTSFEERDPEELPEHVQVCASPLLRALRTGPNPRPRMQQEQIRQAKEAMKQRSVKNPSFRAPSEGESL